eukprot:gene19063-biopygen15476
MRTRTQIPHPNSPPPTLSGIWACVVAAGQAFVAVYADGVIAGAWGHPKWGGALPMGVRGAGRVAAVVANVKAFVVVHGGGGLSAWGDAESGGDLSRPPPNGVMGSALHAAQGGSIQNRGTNSVR